MIIKTKLQREWSCVCTALHMLALEGKQLFPLKAATGLSEGLFHGLHGYGQISPLPSPHTQKAPAVLSLFISLGYSHKEEGKHFFGVLFSGYQVMHSNLNTCFTIAISHIQAASGTGGQVLAWDPFPHSSLARSRAVSPRGQQNREAHRNKLLPGYI